ncbi:MAG: hypothetical protein QHC40_14210 [Sphingobium sp.]|nr:hypothetical protein [Sphingobium sp.]
MQDYQGQVTQLDIDAIADMRAPIGLVRAADGESLDISLMDVVIAIIDMP